jgi:hypothetical protein
MKKIILFLAISLSSVIGFSQQIQFMSAVTATVTATYPVVSVTSSVNGSAGSVQIKTNSAFNGTTSTAALNGSNDGVIWFPVLQSDGVTAMSYTLTASFNKPFNLVTIQYRLYEIIYTKGDATAGTVSATWYSH